MTQDELHHQLEEAGWWNPFAEYDEEPEREIKPPKVKAAKRITPNARLRRPEYKAGKAARKAGTFRNRNPYPDNSLENELWDQGWEAAKKGTQ